MAQAPCKIDFMEQLQQGFGDSMPKDSESLISLLVKLAHKCIGHIISTLSKL